MSKAITVDEAISVTVGEGRIVTGWVVIAEVVNANDEYEIFTMHDGTSSPWKLEGLVNYAVGNGYLLLTSSDEDDLEEED